MVNSLRSLENYLCELLVVSLWKQTPSASLAVSCSEKLHLNLTLAKAVQFCNKPSTTHQESFTHLPVLLQNGQTMLSYSQYVCLPIKTTTYYERLLWKVGQQCSTNTRWYHAALLSINPHREQEHRACEYPGILVSFPWPVYLFLGKIPPLLTAVIIIWRYQDIHCNTSQQFQESRSWSYPFTEEHCMLVFVLYRATLTEDIHIKDIL